MLAPSNAIPNGSTPTAILAPLWWARYHCRVATRCGSSAARHTNAPLAVTCTGSVPGGHVPVTRSWMVAVSTDSVAPPVTVSPAPAATAALRCSTVDPLGQAEAGLLP